MNNKAAAAIIEALGMIAHNQTMGPDGYAGMYTEESFSTLSRGLQQPAEEPASEKGEMPFPTGLDPALAGAIQTAMSMVADKLLDKQKQGAIGWTNTDWEQRCREMLNRAVLRGDPVDVIAYCVFMLWHGWETA